MAGLLKHGLEYRIGIGCIIASFLLACISIGVSFVQAEQVDTTDQIVASSTDTQIQQQEIIATTTQEQTTEIATSTDDTEVASTTSSTTTDTEVASSTQEENIEEDSQVQAEAQPEPVVDDTVPIVPVVQVTPVLSTREFKKHIVVDDQAKHSCTPETFRIDVSGKSHEQAGIVLHKDANNSAYEVEIGSLPMGIDVTFAKNAGYVYTTPAVDDASVYLDIKNEEGSQKGNFSIPIIYTQKGIEDSSVICQINIVNQ